MIFQNMNIKSFNYYIKETNINNLNKKITKKLTYDEISALFHYLKTKKLY